jgi:hypothetical protein
MYKNRCNKIEENRKELGIDVINKKVDEYKEKWNDHA